MRFLWGVSSSSLSQRADRERFANGEEGSGHGDEVFVFGRDRRTNTREGVWDCGKRVASNYQFPKPNLTFAQAVVSGIGEDDAVRARRKSHELGISKTVSSGLIDGVRCVELGETSKEGHNRWKKTVMQHYGAGGSRGKESHTIFVDQLPELMHQAWLKQLFVQCGNIIEVKIPQKRRQATNCKFGFVRFNELEAMNRAIRMFNGVWCDNKKLIVKKARENNNSRQVKRARLQSNTGSEKGQDAVSLGQDNLVVEAREVNEAWLKSCAVGILNEAIKVESIQSAMESEGFDACQGEAGLCSHQALFCRSLPWFFSFAAVAFCVVLVLFVLGFVVVGVLVGLGVLWVVAAVLGGVRLLVGPYRSFGLCAAIVSGLLSSMFRALRCSVLAMKLLKVGYTHGGLLSNLFAASWLCCQDLDMVKTW
ncbi:La-related protein 7 [Sarracenia purpurea var. burkii]